MRRGMQSRSRLGLALLMALVTLAVTPALVARADDDDGKRGRDDGRRARGERPDDGPDREARLRAIEAKIRAAVDAGKLTEEQAAKKLAALKKKLWPDADQKKDYEAVVARIRAAVKAGKLTEEQAAKKLEALRKGKAAGQADGRKRDYQEAAARIKAAVKAGDLTEEEAAARLRAFKERLWGADGRGSDRKDKEGGQR